MPNALAAQCICVTHALLLHGILPESIALRQLLMTKAISLRARSHSAPKHRVARSSSLLNHLHESRAHVRPSAGIAFAATAALKSDWMNECCAVRNPKPRRAQS
jgi:hypothetical protein